MYGVETPSSYVFRAESIDRTPEQKLAVAKIHLMTLDLLGISHGAKEEKSYHKIMAQQWFFEASDFWCWCEMAGFHPEKTAIKVLNLYKKTQYEKPEIIKRMKNKLMNRFRAGEGKHYEKRKAHRLRVQAQKVMLTGGTDYDKMGIRQDDESSVAREQPGKDGTAEDYCGA